MPSMGTYLSLILENQKVDDQSHDETLFEFYESHIDIVPAAGGQDKTPQEHFF